MFAFSWGYLIAGTLVWYVGSWEFFDVQIGTDSFISLIFAWHSVFFWNGLF